MEFLSNIIIIVFVTADVMVGYIFVWD